MHLAPWTLFEREYGAGVPLEMSYGVAYYQVQRSTSARTPKDPQQCVRAARDRSFLSLLTTSSVGSVCAKSSCALHCFGSAILDLRTQRGGRGSDQGTLEYSGKYLSHSEIHKH